MTAKNSRRRVIDAAFRILARDGLDGLTMRAVAREADCTIGLINHWFNSKEDLMIAAWREAVRVEAEAISHLQAQGTYRLDAALLEVLPTTPERREKELVAVSFAAASISNSSIRRIYINRYGNAQRAIAKELMAEGLPSEEAKNTADLLVAAIEGITKLAILKPTQWPAEKQRAALRRLIDPLFPAALRESPAETS